MALRALRCVSLLSRYRTSVASVVDQTASVELEAIQAAWIRTSYRAPVSCEQVFRRQLSWFSSGSGKDPKENDKASTSSADQDGADGKNDAGKSGADAESSSTDEAEVPSLEQEFEKMKSELEQKAAQVDKLTDSLLRTRADMENLRTRTTRDVENAKKFGIQGFVKGLLDIGDNLERAAGSVPESALTNEEDPLKLRQLLKGLQDGVRITEKVFLQVLKQHGVEQYNPVGDAFDPNLHNALFEVPGDKPGTVAVVTKRGYKMHERVVRPAEVGVVKASA